MNFQNLIRNIVKYEYVEKDKFIPENQFGLGYTNLMMIVADIITYITRCFIIFNIITRAKDNLNKFIKV